MRFQGFLAGVEGKEEENDKDCTEDGEDYHTHYHVDCIVGHYLLSRVVGERVGLVHEIAQRPAKRDFTLL
jgi:hypothetical protein